MVQFVSGPNSRAVRDRLFEELDVLYTSERLRGRVAVDVGAGDLVTAERLVVRYGMSVDAVDVVLPESRVVTTVTCDLDGEWLLPGESYDLAVSTSVVEHLENPYHFFRELHRVLKPEGLAIVSTHDINHYWSKLHFLLTNQHKPFVWKCCTAVGDHRMALNEEWLRWIAEREGFVVVKVFYGNPALKVLPFVRPFTPRWNWACQETFLVVRKV